ncbi:hypothetical protein MVES1_001299 [Malassezia vespertilionis]|uniref:uncharacterized protein n=1 Tax=Malassezia vespertilionis TaxID=2020962 RepID=UPI0024B12CB5|nr:uncharacterized protein MVES1_001299 [Malassezia vespertilionis]WFD05961.1 hypothetical protein MVES1_001299 [Malassezia vespertilionis]
MTDIVGRIKDAFSHVAWARIQQYLMYSVPLKLYTSSHPGFDHRSVPMRIRPAMLVLNIIVLIVLGLLGFHPSAQDYVYVNDKVMHFLGFMLHKTFQLGDIIANILGASIGLWLGHFSARAHRERRDLEMLYAPLDLEEHGEDTYNPDGWDGVGTERGAGGAARLTDLWDDRIHEHELDESTELPVAKNAAMFAIEDMSDTEL